MANVGHIHRRKSNGKTTIRTPTICSNESKINRLFIFLIGAIFLYFAVAEPVIHATEGSRIYILGKVAIGGGIFAILGFVLILFGSQALGSMHKANSGSKVPVYVIGAILGIAGIIAMEALKSYLRSKGYVL